MIHVCSLARLTKTVEETGARHIVTLINDNTRVPRPATVAPEDHLFLGMHDIAQAQDGYRAPAAEHVAELIEFVTRWPRSAPLVVHCFAGISRSTAAAYIAACALSPRRCEVQLAQQVRQLSPTAMPNTLLISLADEVLGRKGRMVEAIRAIGPGVAALEGHPFRLDPD